MFSDPNAAPRVVLDGEAVDIARTTLHQLVHLPSVASTMDEAHALAADGAASGTLIVADVQTAGRGRGGKRWESAPGHGLWCTLIERTPPERALDVLSIRIGMAIAEVIAPWCDGRVGLKWPNDVMLCTDRDATLRKLAGVLVEARWRDTTLEWVALGVGINVQAPPATGGGLPAAGLSQHISRAILLERLMPRIRRAARTPTSLSDAEMEQWAARDVMHGLQCVGPVNGVVDGINADGALRVCDSAGAAHSVRSGSLILARENTPC